MIRAKHKVMCPAARKAKILFDSKEKAETFIKFNGGDFEHELKSYYCQVCGGWHLTSKTKRYDRYFTDKVINAYHKLQNQYE